MKKMLTVLTLLCVALLPFSALAETSVISWDDSAALIADSDLTGDFYAIEELGLQIWIPDELNNVEIPAEEAAAGRMYLLMDEEQSCYLAIDAVHVDGMTLDMAYENALNSGMTEPEYVSVNGLDAISYQNDAADIASFVLVDTNSNMIIFSFGPFSEEGADMIFYLICSSIMPLE